MYLHYRPWPNRIYGVVGTAFEFDARPIRQIGAALATEEAEVALGCNDEIRQMRFVFMRDYTKTLPTFSLSAEGRMNADQNFNSLTHPYRFMPLVPEITFDCQPEVGLDPELFDTQCLDAMRRLEKLLSEKLNASEIPNSHYEIIILNKDQQTVTRCRLDGYVIVDTEPVRLQLLFERYATAEPRPGN